MTDDIEGDDNVVAEVDAGGSVDETSVDDLAGRQSLNREQASEQVTRVIEACAQSGIAADDVADLLRDRAEATEYLYEGMQRYASRPGVDDA